MSTIIWTSRNGNWQCRRLARPSNTLVWYVKGQGDQFAYTDWIEPGIAFEMARDMYLLAITGQRPIETAVA